MTGIQTRTILPDDRPLRSLEISATTQAAEGLLRRRWSVAEITAMVRAGIIPADERFELIGGEVVPLEPDTAACAPLRRALAAFWTAHLPQSFSCIVAPTLLFDGDTSLRPDMVFLRSGAALSAATALLVVEIAADAYSLRQRRKTQLYAGHEVAEHWAVDARTLDVHVHRDPYDGEYEGRGLVPWHDRLALPFAPGVRLALRDLGLPREDPALSLPPCAP